MDFFWRLIHIRRSDAIMQLLLTVKHCRTKIFDQKSMGHLFMVLLTVGFGLEHHICANKLGNSFFFNSFEACLLI